MNRSVYTTSNSYMYIGHNNGSKYYSEEKLMKLARIQPVCFLMGCSSLRLGKKERIVVIGTGYYYLLKQCPFVRNR